jgi:hypothetical protein
MARSSHLPGAGRCKNRGRSHPARVLGTAAAGRLRRLGEARWTSAIGTNPNLPSCLRSGRYQVITGPSATRGQHCNSATPRQLTQFARRCSSFTTSGFGPPSTTRTGRPSWSIESGTVAGGAGNRRDHLDRRFAADSPQEEVGFEPSVPPSRERTSDAKSELQEDNSAETNIRRNKAADRLVRRAPEQPCQNLLPPPFLFRHRRARRGAWHGADDLR